MFLAAGSKQPNTHFSNSSSDDMSALQEAVSSGIGEQNQDVSAETENRVGILGF